MRKVALLAVIAMFGLVATGYAQQSAAINLLDSPVKTTVDPANVGETITCSTTLGGGTASLFGVNLVPGTSSQFNGTELFGSFRVFRTDQDCNILGTVNTAFAGTTQTGITMISASNYWVVDPTANATIDEYSATTGAATGNSRPIPTACILCGSLSYDADNPLTANVAILNDIVRDNYTLLDLTNGSTATLGSFNNPDNTGQGAFGNGSSDAADTSACSGAEWVVSSGKFPAEGQVERAGQISNDGSTVCPDTWELGAPLTPLGETFVNGITEYDNGGNIQLHVYGNATGVLFNLAQPPGITDCQGIDGEEVLSWNGSNGGPARQVNQSQTGIATGSIVQPSGPANGKYLIHQNFGAPTSGTITPLPAKLGSSCFDFLIPPFGGGSPVSVYNNVGKTAKVGASNYFGTPQANPPKAPGIWLFLPAGDAVNWTVGDQYTLQGVILNTNASSPKNASVTNAYIVNITP